MAKSNLNITSHSITFDGTVIQTSNISQANIVSDPDYIKNIAMVFAVVIIILLILSASIFGKVDVVTGIISCSIAAYTALQFKQTHSVVIHTPSGPATAFSTTNKNFAEEILSTIHKVIENRATGNSYSYYVDNSNNKVIDSSSNISVKGTGNSIGSVNTGNQFTNL